MPFFFSYPLTEYIASFAFLNPCKLYCKKKGHDGLFVLEDSVQNGVSCMTSSVVSGVCIDDKCIKVDYYHGPTQQCFMFLFLTFFIKGWV